MLTRITRRVLGIDPGARWTALVLAMLDDDGNPLPVDGILIDGGAGVWEAPNRLRDRVAHYDALRAAVEALTDRTRAETGEAPVYAVEAVLWPSKGAPSSRMRVASTRETWAVAMALCPGARMVSPAASGSTSLYPDALRGKRPESWMPGSPAGKGVSRDHERAAYDVARTVLAQLQEEANS